MSTPDQDRLRWQRARAIFDELMELPAVQRESRLLAACGEDAALLAELRTLLSADAALEGADDTLALGRAAPDLLEEFGEDAERASASAWVGTRLGAWQLQRQIGRGGMGAVWLASRADGNYQGQVAIKLMHASIDGEEFVRRFKAERQILAGFDHPNIARLVDAGSDADGRPFLALEYVDGQPITRYCDDRSLSVEQRLRIFLEVCAAVAHAHQRLVVHRDLKPSNILVTAEGRVRLLDFGIAKLISADEATTRTGSQTFTPAYAAPEQIRGALITTGVDVHALGLLLHELLTGMRAYGHSDSTPAAYEQAILNQSPPLPSRAVLEPGAKVDESAPNRARARRLSPVTLAARLRGDLDAIVQKALRKEPEQRYSSVEALVEDLRRHLDHLPVQARRGRLRYRIGRFLRRHALASALVGLAALSLLTGIGIALWQAQLARAERDRAQTALATAERVTGFVTHMLSQATADAGQGHALTVREVLDQTAKGLDEELADEVAVRARIHLMLGQVYDALMDNSRAEESIRAALQATESAHGRRSLEMLSVQEMLFRVLSKGDAQAEATQAAEESLALATDLLGPQHQRTLTQLSNLGVNHLNHGRVAQAAEHFQRALDGLRAQPDANPRAVANMLHNVAVALNRAERYEEADTVQGEALAIRKSLFSEPHTNIAVGQYQVAMVKTRRGQYAEAAQYFQAARAQYVTLYGPDSIAVANMDQGLAFLELHQGHLEQAIALLRPVLLRYRELTGERSRETADCSAMLADALQRSGRNDEALALVEHAIGVLEALYPPGHPDLALALRTRLRILQARGIANCDLAERILLMLRRSYDESHSGVVQAVTDLRSCHPDGMAGTDG